MNLYDYTPYDSAVRGLRACERDVENARLRDGTNSESYRAASAALAEQEQYVKQQREAAERFFSAA